MTEPKIPPHNLEAERSLLGALLIDKDAVIKVVDFLRPDHFYRDAHGAIFDAILSLYEKGEPVDLITVTSILKKKKKLKSVGGASYLAELTEAVPTSSHVEHYGKLIYDSAVKRKLISVSSEIAERGFNDSLSVEELLDKAESSLFSISQARSRSIFSHIKQSLEEAFDRLDELHKNPDAMRGVPTGFKSLDERFGGLQRSNMVVLAGRPSLGKTSLALNIAQHAAVEKKIPVGIFSLETSRNQLVHRLLSAQADIDAWKLQKGKLEEGDFKRLGEAMGVLAEAPIFIDDTPALTVMEMRTRARKLQMEHDVQLLVVDYMQLARGRNLENRVQEVSEISRALKNLARELDIPVLALSQLSRAVESRGESRPQLSDLRESGSIEQDADIVMFLYRDDPDERENIRLFVAKHRNGPTGEIPLRFRGERTRFYEADENR
ncbi:MAG: replicative DNA helicase [Patescibacteria group bacterium]|nr:MAG: replicative DNA helicase [Patescibacteria group bacterium]